MARQRHANTSITFSPVSRLISITGMPSRAPVSCIPITNPRYHKPHSNKQAPQLREHTGTCVSSHDTRTPSTTSHLHRTRTAGNRRLATSRYSSSAEESVSCQCVVSDGQGKTQNTVYKPYYNARQCEHALTGLQGSNMMRMLEAPLYFEALGRPMSNRVSCSSHCNTQAYRLEQTKQCRVIVGDSIPVSADSAHMNASASTWKRGHWLHSPLES